MGIQVRYQDAPTGSAPKTAADNPILVERMDNLHKQACMIVEQLELIKSDVHQEPPVPACVSMASVVQDLPHTLDHVTLLVCEKQHRALELLREISEWV